MDFWIGPNVSLSAVVVVETAVAAIGVKCEGTNRTKDNSKVLAGITKEVMVSFSEFGDYRGKVVENKDILFLDQRCLSLKKVILKSSFNHL